jgi:hypothetical protein
VEGSSIQIGSLWATSSTRHHDIFTISHALGCVEHRVRHAANIGVPQDMGNSTLAFCKHVTTNSGQDSRTARFTPCFVPFVATLPTVIATLILLTYSLRLLNPYRPRWTKPFLKETKAASDEFDDAPCYRMSASTWSLFTLTLIGIVSQVTAMLFPARITAVVYPTIAWVRQSF